MDVVGGNPRPGGHDSSLKSYGASVWEMTLFFAPSSSFEENESGLDVALFSAVSAALRMISFCRTWAIYVKC